MGAIPAISLRKWRKAFTGALNSAISFPVFLVLDLVDLALCFFFRFADAVFKGSSFPQCYCWSGGNGKGNEEDEEMSKTLYHRRNIFRGLRLPRTEGRRRNGVSRSPRWSDCCCEICVSWIGGARRNSISFSSSRMKPIRSREVHQRA